MNWRSLYAGLERGLKSLLLKPIVWWRYGTLRPECARLHGCDHWLYIDPNDPCAYKKVVLEPLRGKVSAHLIFWRELNAHWKPKLAIDVGVNYGECLFGASYAPGTRVVGFEANPRLLPLLQRSLAAHPNKDSIQLIHCLVSDRSAEEVPFKVNLEWSGGSSAVLGLNTGSNCAEYRLPARTIDSQIPADWISSGDLVFKMDVEGFESFALRGFTGTLDAARRTAGFVEFNVRYIRAAGENPDTYFNFLAGRFEIFCFASAKRRTVRRLKSRAEISNRHGVPDGQCADLILVSRKNAHDWLPTGWQLVND